MGTKKAATKKQDADSDEKQFRVASLITGKEQSKNADSESTPSNSDPQHEYGSVVPGPSRDVLSPPKEVFARLKLKKPTYPTFCANINFINEVKLKLFNSMNCWI